MPRPVPATPAAQRGPATGILRRSFSSLHIRNYRLWFVGQTVSQSGTWMQSTAQIWLVFMLTHHNAFDVGLTAGLQFAPVLVLGAFGGLVADRFDKRKVLLLTQSAFTIQAVALFAIVVTGAVQLWMVWVLASVMGLVNAIDNPSRQSFVVEMVGPDDLANAVGLNSVIVNASRLVGPALAGVFILVTGNTVSGLSWIFLVNALSFGAVIGALSAMRPGELHRRAPVARAAGQVRAGLRYAWHKRELRVLLLMMAVVGTLAFNFNVFLPLFAGTVFHRGGGTYSALLVAMAVGALTGSLYAASRRRPSYRLLSVVTPLFGAFIIAVAVAPSLPLTLLVLVPMGAASVVFIATANSLLQLHSTPAMRGRVMALWAIVFLGSTPIGAPLTGFLSGLLGARTTLALAGGATLLTACGAWPALRRMSNASRPHPETDDRTAPQHALPVPAPLTTTAGAPARSS